MGIAIISQHYFAPAKKKHQDKISASIPTVSNLLSKTETETVSCFFYKEIDGL